MYGCSLEATHTGCYEESLDHSTSLNFVRIIVFFSRLVSAPKYKTLLSNTLTLIVPNAVILLITVFATVIPVVLSIDVAPQVIIAMVATGVTRQAALVIHS